jgi:mono/diheme cytochrome c family protein
MGKLRARRLDHRDAALIVLGRYAMNDNFRKIISRDLVLCVIATLSLVLAGCGNDSMTTPSVASTATTGTSTTGTSTTGTSTTGTSTTGTSTTGTSTTGTGTTGTGTTGTGTTGTGTTGTGTTGTGTTGTGTTGTGTTGTGTTGTGTTGTGTTTTATASSITLAAPATTVNRMVVLTAAPSTASGATVVAVTFLVDGVSIGSTASVPYSFQWDTAAVADGTHILTASLTDSSGKTTISPSVSVKVMNNQALTFGLSASQIFPVTTSTASGFATLTVNVVTGMASGNVIVTGTTATAAAVFQGFAGQTGTTQITLKQNAANPKEWDVPTGTVLTPAQVTMLLQGSMYVQVASAAFPNGEIRGQVIPAGVTVTWSPVSGTQEAQVVGTQATGTAATTVDTLGNNVTVFVNTTGVIGVTTVELSTGAAGMAGTELVALTLGTMNGTIFNPNEFSIQMFPIAATDVMNFQAGMWYVNVTTAANPMGLIRGQIIPAPTLTQIQTAIFTPVCSSCHTGVGTQLPGALNLTSAAASYKALVGVFTVEQPTVEFVSPGNAANSYLIQKLQGAVTISGKQMPLGGPYLSAAQITQIAQWIAAGPQND